MKTETFEIILVIDGSCDRPEAVCQQMADRYQNVPFTSPHRNLWASKAVLCGLNHVQGQYIVRIDDDCQNPPEKTESEVYRPGSWVNETLCQLVRIEQKRLHRTPFGNSLFMLVDKVDGLARN